MGEAPPYTAQEITERMLGTTFKEVRSYDECSVVFVLEKDGKEIEMEVWASPEWPGASDMVETKEIDVEICVYLRGVD